MFEGMVNPQDLLDIATQLAEGMGDGTRGRFKQSDMAIRPGNPETEISDSDAITT